MSHLAPIGFTGGMRGPLAVSQPLKAAKPLGLNQLVDDDGMHISSPTGVPETPKHHHKSLPGARDERQAKLLAAAAAPLRTDEAISIALEEDKPAAAPAHAAADGGEGEGDGVGFSSAELNGGHATAPGLAVSADAKRKGSTSQRHGKRDRAGSRARHSHHRPHEDDETHTHHHRTKSTSHNEMHDKPPTIVVHGSNGEQEVQLTSLASLHSSSTPTHAANGTATSPSSTGSVVPQHDEGTPTATRPQSTVPPMSRMKLDTFNELKFPHRWKVRGVQGLSVATFIMGVVCLAIGITSLESQFLFTGLASATLVAGIFLILFAPVAAWLTPRFKNLFLRAVYVSATVLALYTLCLGVLSATKKREDIENEVRIKWSPVAASSGDGGYDDAFRERWGSPDNVADSAMEHLNALSIANLLSVCVLVLLALLTLRVSQILTQHLSVIELATQSKSESSSKAAKRAREVAAYKANMERDPQLRKNLVDERIPPSLKAAKKASKAEREKARKYEMRSPTAASSTPPANLSPRSLRANGGAAADGGAAASGVDSNGAAAGAGAGASGDLGLGSSSAKRREGSEGARRSGAKAAAGAASGHGSLRGPKHAHGHGHGHKKHKHTKKKEKRNPLAEAMAEAEAGPAVRVDVVDAAHSAEQKSPDQPDSGSSSSPDDKV